MLLCMCFYNLMQLEIASSTTFKVHLFPNPPLYITRIFTDLAHWAKTVFKLAISVCYVSCVVPLYAIFFLIFFLLPLFFTVFLKLFVRQFFQFLVICSLFFWVFFIFVLSFLLLLFSPFSQIHFVLVILSAHHERFSVSRMRDSF